MNPLLKNLIAKLRNKDFPGYGEGDGWTRKELGKKAYAGTGAEAPSGPKKASRH